MKSALKKHCPISDFLDPLLHIILDYVLDTSIQSFLFSNCHPQNPEKTKKSQIIYDNKVMVWERMVNKAYENQLNSNKDTLYLMNNMLRDVESNEKGVSFVRNHLKGANARQTQIWHKTEQRKARARPKKNRLHPSASQQVYRAFVKDISFCACLNRAILVT